MGKLKIVSDGTAHGTKLYDHGGSLIQNITSIKISPIVPNSLITVTVEFCNVELDMVLTEKENNIE